jgi:hypothetical protein
VARVRVAQVRVAQVRAARAGALSALVLPIAPAMTPSVRHAPVPAANAGFPTRRPERP